LLARIEQAVANIQRSLTSDGEIAEGDSDAAEGRLAEDDGLTAEGQAQVRETSTGAVGTEITEHSQLAEQRDRYLHILNSTGHYRK